jgi:hypothetical protein
VGGRGRRREAGGAWVTAAVDRWSRRTGAWAEEVEEQIGELTPVDPGRRDEINQARSGEQLTPARRKVGVGGWLGYGIVIPYPRYEI